MGICVGIERIADFLGVEAEIVFTPQPLRHDVGRLVRYRRGIIYVNYGEGFMHVCRERRFVVPRVPYCMIEGYWVGVRDVAPANVGLASVPR